MSDRILSNDDSLIVRRSWEQTQMELKNSGKDPPVHWIRRNIYFKI